MTSPQTVHIVGAGLAGLTLARSLKNRGIRSIIFEKNASPARHNYGITLQPWACQALLRLLDLDEPTLHKRIAVDSAIGGRGYVFEKYPVSPWTQSLSLLRAHCGRLETLLRDSLDIKWGHALEEISRDASGHTLKFKDQISLQSEFVVDCSGVHSVIRNSLLPDLPLEILAYVVFRGTRRLAGDVFRDRYSRHFKFDNVIQMKRSGTLLQIQVNEYLKEGDEVYISYIYSRPAQEVPNLHHDERRIEDAEKVVSDVFFEEIAGHIEHLPAPFAETFALEKLHNERILHWLMRDVVVPLPDLLQLAAEGLVLVGDSAHAMPILGGQGASYAIKNACDLGGVLGERGPGGVKGFFKAKHEEWVVAVDQCERRLADMHHLVDPVLQF